MRAAAFSTLLVATAASAAHIAVSVGQNNGLTYAPSSVKAAVGDVITFTFLSKNHTVTQSTFKDPCDKAPNAIDSGFRPTANAAAAALVFNVTVNSTNPLWFYCAQVNHCKLGMVFAINPTVDQTFAQFQSNAQNGGSSTNSTGSGGSSGSSSGSQTPTASAPYSSKTNAAVTTKTHFAGLLTLAGLVAGLAL